MALSVLRGRLSDAWSLRGRGFGMTTSVRWPLRRIDYLMVSGIEVGDIRVLDHPLSDHRAVITTFALDPELARRDAAASAEAHTQADAPGPARPIGPAPSPRLAR
jgi:hypothetical protein